MFSNPRFPHRFQSFDVESVDTKIEAPEIVDDIYGGIHVSWEYSFVILTFENQHKNSSNNKINVLFRHKYKA